MSKSRKRVRSKRSKRRTDVTKNKYLIWIIVALIGASLFLAGMLIYPSINRADQILPIEISVGEAYERYLADAFLLDIRQSNEWVDYHIPGSTLIPLEELASRIDEIPRDQEVVLICRTGNRSQDGYRILQSAGFENVFSMAGGINAWRDQSYPIETGP